MSGPKYIPCKEDDDLLSAFDKMMADSAQVGWERKWIGRGGRGGEGRGGEGRVDGRATGEDGGEGKGWGGGGEGEGLVHSHASQLLASPLCGQ